MLKIYFKMQNSLRTKEKVVLTGRMKTEENEKQTDMKLRQVTMTVSLVFDLSLGAVTYLD